MLSNRLSRLRGTKSAGSDGAAGGGRMPQGVHVVKQQTVAGMKATVLRANDVKALRKWLSKHGYPADKAVLNWTEHYIRSNYYLTAFKIDRRPGDSGVSTSAMKMVFKTPFAYYPYREPISSKRRRGRNLSIYFLGPWIAVAHYEGTNRMWGASRMPFDQITAEETRAIAKLAKLPARSVPHRFSMTHFFDRSEVRIGHDLRFGRVPIR